MKLSKIQELLRIVSESSVAEIEIEEDDFKLTIRQNAPQVLMQPRSYPMQMPYGAPAAYQGPPGAAPVQQQPAGGQAQQAPAPHAPVTQNAGGGATASGGTANQTANAAPSDGTATEESASEDDAPDADGYVVKAPIVGTFYEAPSPDSDPYVQVGDRVSEGDVLCIIEAMKLMNEIEVETSGTIQEVLVDDAEPVEFDQPLFVIDED